MAPSTESDEGLVDESRKHFEDALDGSGWKRRADQEVEDKRDQNLRPSLKQVSLYFLFL